MVCGFRLPELAVPGFVLIPGGVTIFCVMDAGAGLPAPPQPETWPSKTTKPAKHAKRIAVSLQPHNFLVYNQAKNNAQISVTSGARHNLGLTNGFGSMNPLPLVVTAT